MARRTRPTRSKIQNSAASDKAVESLLTPQGIFRTSRTLAMRVVGPYAPAVTALIPVYDERVPTMGVDGFWRCYVSEQFIKECVTAAERVSKEHPCGTCGATNHHKFSYVAGVILHEADHMRRKHCRRLKKMASKGALGNIAADCELNDDLLEIFEMAHSSDSSLPRLCLPHLPIVLPKGYDMPNGKLMEWYYHELRNKQNEGESMPGMPQPGEGDPSQGGGDPTASPGKGGPTKGGGRPVSSDQDGFDEAEHGDPTFDETRKKMGQKVTDCGSGADGEARSWEKGEPGDGDEGHGISEAEGDRIIKEVARRVKDAAARGNMPGRLADWAEMNLAPPKYNWRKVLSRTFRRAVATAYGFDQPTYRRFHRDCAASDYSIIAPATEKPVPNVHVVIDSSGSMGRANVQGEGLQVAVSECEGLAKATGANITIIPVDCHVNVKDIKTTNSVKNVNIGAAGGTDMRVGFEASSKHGRKPSVLVVLTDGLTPWPEVQPKGVHVVIGVCGPHIAEDRNSYPTWAKVVRCDDIDCFA